MSKYKKILIAPGEIDQDIHYGPFAIYWWNFIEEENTKICYPIRINMRIKIELNKKEFIIRTVVNTNDGMKPGYIYEEDNDAMIYSTPSEVVNENYKKFFDKATRYPGPSILGFDDKIFIEQLQVNVLFFPFEIVTNGIKVFVAALGSSDEKELNFAGSGYCSSFHYRYSGKKSLICQSINDKNCQIDIYFQGKIVYTQTGITPTDVWEKLPIVKGTGGKELFGLCDQLVIQAIKKHIDAPYCTSSHWDNIEIMTNAFKRCLKKKISVVNVDWYQFFTKWKQQSTTIIEFTSHISSIYSEESEVADIILRSWRRMMRYVGCTNITPYEKDVSRVSI
jgi:hypothetical protein